MKNVDAAIAELGAKLDSWFDRNRATFASHDRNSQSKALLAGIEIVQELDSLKQQGLRTIRTLLQRRNATTPREHIAGLLCGFELATKLGDALHNELLDTDGENKFIGLLNEIAEALDATDRGRGELAALLDHPDAGVRASAGAYLIHLMPERVVPILREIDETDQGLSADFTAHWALLDWELKQKAAGKKL